MWTAHSVDFLLLLCFLLSLAYSLNPRDPNVCSLWERWGPLGSNKPIYHWCCCYCCCHDANAYFLIRHVTWWRAQRSKEQHLECCITFSGFLAPCLVNSRPRNQETLQWKVIAGDMFCDIERQYKRSNLGKMYHTIYLSHFIHNSLSLTSLRVQQLKSTVFTNQRKTFQNQQHACLLQAKQYIICKIMLC